MHWAYAFHILQKGKGGGGEIRKMFSGARWIRGGIVAFTFHSSLNRSLNHYLRKFIIKKVVTLYSVFQ